MNTVTLVAILLAAAYGGAAWLLRCQYGSDAAKSWTATVLKYDE